MSYEATEKTAQGINGCVRALYLRGNLFVTDVHKRIDKKEKERIKKLDQALEDDKPITLTEVFDSEIIPNILEERPLSYIESFDKENIALPVNCLLFPKILVTICPGCSCNANPELIKPYLEREMILPLLQAPLSKFKVDFANLVIQYPYVGVEALHFLKYIQLVTSKEGMICPHCFAESCQRISKKISKTSPNQKKADLVRGYLKNVTFPILTPTADQEFQILREIEDAVGQNRIGRLLPLTDKAIVLHLLRSSQIFDAIPQVAQKDLSNIAEILRKTGLSLDPTVINQIEEKKWIIKALNIDYDPKMPVEDYLGIIHSRRRKIHSLLDELILSKEKDQRLSRINDEVWKINEEISSSKSIESLTFLTNFVSDNAKILFGMLIGGLVGYSSASFVGCGLGSAGGLASGIAGKLISKYMPFEVPKYPRKTIEWIKEKVESPEEKLLSIMLSKDIKAIQVWALRKKLKKV